MSDIVIRFADSDDDVIAIHAFLCVMEVGRLPADIDPKKSATEVWRVVKRECALMALDGDLCVGTLGIVRADFWWGNQAFLANRWFHAMPARGIGKLLLREGERFAKEVGLELHIIDESKGRILILNRHPARKTINPLFVPLPVQPTHEAVLTIQ